MENNEAKPEPTKELYEATPQKGVPGHCYAAQVFKKGIAFLTIDPTPDEMEATRYANHVANCLNRIEAKRLIEQLTTSESRVKELEYIQNCFDATWTENQGLQTKLAESRLRVKELEALQENYHKFLSQPAPSKRLVKEQSNTSKERKSTLVSGLLIGFCLGFCIPLLSVDHTRVNLDNAIEAWNLGYTQGARNSSIDRTVFFSDSLLVRHILTNN